MEGHRTPARKTAGECCFGRDKRAFGRIEAGVVPGNERRHPPFRRHSYSPRPPDGNRRSAVPGTGGGGGYPVCAHFVHERPAQIRSDHGPATPSTTSRDGEELGSVARQEPHCFAPGIPG